MKFTLAQLTKLPMPYKIAEELDLSLELNGFEDIISIGKTLVEYEIKPRGTDTYLFNFHIKADLVMQCAISLQEVPIHIDTLAEEIYTTDNHLEDAFIIEGQTLDTKEAVLTNILVNKPMKVVAPNVNFNDDVDDSDDGEGSINPAFAKLKDLL